MEVSIVTKEDLETLRSQIVNDFKVVVSQLNNSTRESPQGYKTAQVRKMLGCCYNTLVSLRVTRKIRTKKIGGSIYYNKDDVRKLLDEGY